MNKKVTDNEKKSPSKKEQAPVEDVSAGELSELKKDMQAAAIMDWVHRNQQQLIAVGIAFLLILMGTSLWMERSATQKESAASLFSQGMGAADSTQQQDIFESVVQNYGDTAYAPLSLMQLVRLDAANAEAHLKALISHSKASREFVWQARLDLAARLIREGKPDEARKWLDDEVGEQYAQLRFYLLAEASATDSLKREYLTKALQAVSLDDDLKRRIESGLALLGTDAAASSGE